MASVGGPTLKCGVNTRASLASRLPKNKEPAPYSRISLHRSEETTYDIDYTPPGIVKQTGTDASTIGEQENYQIGAKSDGGSAMSNGDGADQNSLAQGAGTSQNQQIIGAYKTSIFPSSLWESEAHAATRSILPEQQLDFFSNVRKIEAKDDEMRGGLVGRVQRSVDIAQKRATDPSMQMKPPQYAKFNTTEFPLVAAHERQILKKNYLDLVECVHLDPDTEQQIGYNAQPETRLPGLDLSQSHEVQSKAITRMATSEDLFRKTPKFFDDKLVLYGGHVPYHPRNIDAMHGNPDFVREWSKSYMTLATHGGGVDSSVVSSNAKASLRSGKHAPPAQMLKPKSDVSIRLTTEGNLLQQTLHDTTDREKKMNFRNDKMGHLYF